MSKLPKRLQVDSKVRKDFDDIFDRAGSMLQERSTALKMMKLALLTNHHMLMIGSPGIAKSYMVKAIFECFGDAEYFKIACTKRMSEEYLVGPLDMKLFRDSGEYRHNTQGSLITAHFAFLDEFLDLPDQALRALLEVLNERTFSRGQQREEARLMTAIAATNFTPDRAALEAVEDRFLLRAQVRPLKSNNTIAKMLRQSAEQNPPIPEKKFLLKDLDFLKRRVASVRVPELVYDLIGDLAHKLRTSNEKLNITDRRIVWSIPVLKACAYLNQRQLVLPSDLANLEYVFTIQGDDKHGSIFANGVKNALSDAPKLDSALLSLEAMTEALSILSSDLNTAVQSSDTAAVTACTAQLNDFIKALEEDKSVQCIKREVTGLVKEATGYKKIADDALKGVQA